MKRIPLTQGQFALVDDEDYDALMKYKWHATWLKNTNTYCATRCKLKTDKRAIAMHRQIMNDPDGLVVDHINHDTLDNQGHNLRVCSNGQNARNKKLYRNNKSGFKGVFWRKDKNKWLASISVNNKQLYLGIFHCKHAAARAYNDAAIKYHGKFAYLNKIDIS